MVREISQDSAGPLVEEQELTFSFSTSPGFQDLIPSCPRLQKATSLLSRIKTLSVDISSWAQKNRPFFDHPDVLDEETEEPDYEGCQLLLPHRLLAFTTSPTTYPLPLQSLILPSAGEDIFGFLALQLLPYSLPSRLHTSIGRGAAPGFGFRPSHPPPSSPTGPSWNESLG